MHSSLLFSLYDRKNISGSGITKSNTNRNLYTVDNGVKLREFNTKEYGRRFNIWRYNQGTDGDDFSKKHPASFGETLVKDHILSWSNENDVVLDPFMGSGTTALACIKTNRKYIGIELNKDYVELLEKRINDLVI